MGSLGSDLVQKKLSDVRCQGVVMSACYIYVLYDEVNEKPLLKSEDYFRLADYRYKKGYSDDYGYGIKGVNVNDCDYGLLDELREVETLRL